ncbi:hypothetical protein JCM5350_004025 [Sporobolomyces pararoseus]
MRSTATTQQSPLRAKVPNEQFQVATRDEAKCPQILVTTPPEDEGDLSGSGTQQPSQQYREGILHWSRRRPDTPGPNRLLSANWTTGQNSRRNPVNFSRKPYSQQKQEQKQRRAETVYGIPSGLGLETKDGLPNELDEQSALRMLRKVSSDHHSALFKAHNAARQTFATEESGRYR